MNLALAIAIAIMNILVINNIDTFNVTPFKLLLVEGVAADFLCDTALTLALAGAANNSLLTITPGLQSLEVEVEVEVDFAAALAPAVGDDTRLIGATEVDEDVDVDVDVDGGAGVFV